MVRIIKKFILKILPEINATEYSNIYSSRKVVKNEFLLPKRHIKTVKRMYRNPENLEPETINILSGSLKEIISEMIAVESDEKKIEHFIPKS